VFATNHRSFFDQFAVLLGLYLTGTPWCRTIRFPVRSNFFYERPIGMVINHAIAGGVMYPPIFRQAEKTAFNKDAIDRLIKLLAEPGVVIGIHPEGTWGKGPDCRGSFESTRRGCPPARARQIPPEPAAGRGRRGNPRQRSGIV
jgi:hypothetical protein